MSTVARRSGRMEDMLKWLDDSGFPIRSGLGLIRDIRIEDYVEDGTYVMRAEIPGVDPDKDLEVGVEDDMLFVRGERREEQRDKEHRELHYGSFERSVRLPKGAHVDQIAATYTDGVLEVRLPFDAEPPAPSRRTVPVQRSAD
jgi:HSP20 family protein